MLTLTALVLTLTATTAAATKKPDWAALDKDVHKAIGYAAATWGVSATWMHSCAHSEGGHGRFVDNKPYIRTTVPRIYGDRWDGDGWFQYLSGTWAWMSNAAWKTGRLKGLVRPPIRYKRVDSPLGQAYTTAWAFSRGFSYHWYGSGC
jgi:hypothetical protein